MFNFLDSTTDTGAALSGSYIGVLVLFSYAVAVLASFAGFRVSERIKSTDTTRLSWLWLIAGSTSMGIGIWAMHFTGMLAFVLPVPVAYDLAITCISVVPAVFASGIVLYIMATANQSHGTRFISGCLLGAGIGVMHFIGMSAMRMQATMQYDPTLFTGSIIVAAILGIVALYAHDFAIRSPYVVGPDRWRLAAAAIMGLAITGMHYTAMLATHFFPVIEKDNGASIVDGYRLLDPYWLSVGIIAVTVFFIALAIVATVVDERLQSANHFVLVSRQRMLEAIESISDGFVLFDRTGALLMCNNVFRGLYPSMREILTPGSRYEDLMRNWANLQERLPENASVQEYVAKHVRQFKKGFHVRGDNREERLSDGRWMYVSQRPIESGGMVGIWRDVTPIKELQAVYKRLAHHDPLTGLPNRKLFDDRLEHAAAHSRRLDGTIAVLYIDLDGFKPVNDTLGHDAGDVILKEVATRLKGAVRDTDTVARLGGDEFAIVLEPQSNRSSAEMTADRILRSLSEPILAGKRECVVGASIGIALSRAEEFDNRSLVDRADAAMYEAKTSGRNTYRISSN